jgi:putative ABC transport system permease protein
MTTKTNDRGAAVWQMTLMGLRYLNGRRLRTVLTTLAIVFGVALIFAINLVLPTVSNVFKQSMTAMTGADITITSVSGESFTPDSVLPLVSDVENVRAVSGVLRRRFTIPVLSDNALGGSAELEIIGIDPISAQNVRQFPISEGRFFDVGESNAAVVPAGIAVFAPELNVGTVFPLITAGGLKLYTVIGFLAEQGDMSTPQIYVSLSDAQAAFNQPGLINIIEVSVEAGADQAAVIANLQQVLGSGFVMNAESTGGAAVASVQIGLAIFNMLGALALFLGAFLIFNTFRTVVVERRHDLAMLRAVGATRRQVTTMIVIESLLQGIVGTIIGMILGYLMAAGGFAIMGDIWTTYLRIQIPQLELNVTAVVLAGVSGIVTALLAGYLPARAAGRTSPLEALRPSTVASVERAARWSLIVGAVLVVFGVLLMLTGTRGAAGGAILFLFGMVIAAPGLVIPASHLFSPLLTLWFAREGDLARGNLVRQPGRAAITGGTLMIGLAVLVMAAALVTAFTALVEDLADANFASDILLVPQSIAVYNTVIGADESLANRLRELPEVETVGTLRYAASSSNGSLLQVMGIDPSEYPQVATFEFSEGDPETAFAELGSGRNAIVTSIAMSTLGLTVGGDLVLETAEGPQTYRVVAAANDILTFKVNAIFISQENLAADFHKAEDILLMINLTPGADEATAMASVETIAADYPQFTAQLTAQYRDTLVQTSAGAMVMFYVLAFLILLPAALGLLNTLTINILERTREIGVVRAVGGSRNQVRRMITGEALLLGIFGASMGVLAGVAMSYGFIAAMGSIGWTVPYAFPLMGIIAAIVLGVLLALFSSILPARNATKLDIIRALQYE